MQTFFSGQVYLVFKVYQADENSRANTMMPETVVHTWTVEKLPENELEALAAKSGYMFSAYGARPFSDFHLIGDYPGSERS